MLKKFRTESHKQRIQRRIRDKYDGRRLAIESAKFEYYKEEAHHQSIWVKPPQYIKIP